MNPNAPRALIVPSIPLAVRAALTPQAENLVDYMNRMGSVTQREALIELSVQSLTKRIHELRKHFVIVSDKRIHKTTSQRYVRYFLKGLKPATQVAQELRNPMPAEPVLLGD